MLHSAPSLSPHTEETVYFRFPKTLGTLKKDYDLASHTWFKVGGKADYFFTPAHLEDLRFVLKELAGRLPITLLGAGSNVLVRDGGIRGAVISLKNLNNFSLEGSLDINVGAGILDKKLAMYAYKAHLSGFEFLYTIPGTLGGALAMNAGAYGREISDCLIQAILMTHRGEIFSLTREELAYAYRHCKIPAKSFFVGAKLRGIKGDQKLIYETMVTLSEKRRHDQPSGLTGGSTFKNPPQKKAWELIQEAGCTSLEVGGASVSEKHCNFLLNRDKASAKDLENLVRKIHKQVTKKTGVSLMPEIIFLGDKV